MTFDALPHTDDKIRDAGEGGEAGKMKETQKKKKLY